MSVDTPQGAGLVSDPFLNLHLVLTVTRVIQGNVGVIHPMVGPGGGDVGGVNDFAYGPRYSNKP